MRLLSTITRTNVYITVLRESGIPVNFGYVGTTFSALLLKIQITNDQLQPPFPIHPNFMSLFS